MNSPFTLQGLIRILWSFFKGFTDSFRGTMHLFSLDREERKHRETRRQELESKKELLLNRDSPARESESFAKKRAIERREQNRIKPNPLRRMQVNREEPKILDKTIKCCVLNGVVFFLSIVFFNRLIIPAVQNFFLSPLLRGVMGAEAAENLWRQTQSVLSLAFSTLWVLPFYVLSKIVNAIWFQEIADQVFLSSRGRQQTMSSFSVTVADTVFSVVIEAIFLIQGKLCSYMPIPSIGLVVNMLHLCLLNSLYCFEYKWFNQGLELHRRLTYIENHWPYFLGFGLPLSILTSMTESHVISGCLFAVLFPLFIVSAQQAQVVTVSDTGEVVGDLSLPIFHPTIAFSNAIFSRTLRRRAAHTTQVPCAGGAIRGSNPVMTMSRSGRRQ